MKTRTSSRRLNFLAASATCLLLPGTLCAQDVPPAMIDKQPAATSQVVVPRHPIAQGPFEPTWDSLGKNRAPDWFRDAKFGVWAHWSAQCVPEMGDWYARRMYMPEEEKWARLHPVTIYDYHCKTYGHPSKFGFMEIDNLWKAEKWEPEKLMDLYVRAGAKYFIALANHHDNFDTYDSKYHDWNSVKVGPHKDIVGTWQKAALARGLHFGISNHSSQAWHWLQAAYGYDPEGEFPGVRFDAYTLHKEDGKGKWWEGLDPQDLYTGPLIVMPDGFKTRKEAADWRAANNKWQDKVTPNNPKFVENWFLRAQDAIDKYHPDFIYFDNAGLPFGQIGLDLIAHYYNASANSHDGKAEVVATSNGMDQFPPGQRNALVGSFEGFGSDELRAEPWETAICIGSWHYERSRFVEHKYESVDKIIRMLTDIVSKNGNLLLSIPQRGDGTIDDDERKFLESMAAWMAINSECIFGTRPWKIYGEGPSVEAVLALQAKGAKGGKGGKSLPASAEDFRFTTKGDTLYAITAGWPKNGNLVVKSLAKNAPNFRPVNSVRLLGVPEPLKWSQTEAGLEVQVPATPPCEHAYALKIE